MSDASTPWQPGALLASGEPRFEIEQLLGEGGMGTVYLAFDHERQMRVALKTLRDRDPRSLARFKREFRLLADVAHGGLVELYELFAEDGAWFYTMEAVSGRHFDVYLGATHASEAPTRLDDDELPPPAAPATVVSRARLARPFVDVERLRPALEQLTAAIEALHAAGMTHCDLKPSNVLVQEDGRVVVLDFGLTQPRRDDDLLQVHVEGTPHYLAPELLYGAAPSPRSDFYAIGVMLYRALTGRLPFLGDSSGQLQARRMGETIPKVGTLIDELPAGLAELVDGLLDVDPDARLGGSAIRAWLGNDAEPRIGEPRFVGRDAELAELERVFEAAAAGAPSYVIVQGPSGIGKSALLREFARRLGRRAYVFSGRCYEREQVPFKALDGVVDVIAAHLAARRDAAALVPRGMAALAVLFPVLRAVPAIDALPLDPHLEPSAVRALAAEAIPILLARLALQRPVVIAIDDLQWSDEDSASLLTELIDPNSRTPLLFVASARSGVAESGMLQAIRRHTRRRTEIEVGALTHSSCAELAEGIVHDPARAEAIAREAKGLPFFAVELARWGGQQALALDDVIGARAAELPAEARRLLQLSALAGVPLPSALLAEAAALGSDPLPHLRLLAARSLLRTASLAHNEVEPYHDRVREVVGAALGPEERCSLHAKLGDALAAAGADPELVGRHLGLGGDPVRARPFVLQAAVRATAALAHERAVTLYRTALEQASSTEHATASLELAEALVLAGRSAEAAAIFAERARLAETDDERTHARRRAAAEWLKCGELDRGIAELRAVLRGVGLRYPDSPTEAFLRAATGLLRIRSWDGRFEPRDEHEVRPEVLARMDAVRAAGVGLIQVDPLRGYGFLARFLLDARATGEPRRIGIGLAFNAITLCRGGRAGFPQAQRWLRIARDTAEHLDDDYLRGLSDAAEAAVRICTGEWPLALRFGDRAVNRLRGARVSATAEITSTHAVMRSSRFFSGDLLGMRVEIERQLRAAEAVGDRFAATFARVHRWAVSAMDDDVPRGRAMLADALGTWSGLGFHTMHYWRLFGELQFDLYEGKAAQGLERLARARPALARSRILGMQVYRAWLTGTEANLWLAAGDLRQAAVVAGKLEALDLSYASAFALVVRARVLQSRRPSKAAAAAAGAALRFDALSMRLHAAGARALHGRMVGNRTEEDGALQVIAAEGVKRPERWLKMVGA